MIRTRLVAAACAVAALTLFAPAALAKAGGNGGNGGSNGGGGSNASSSNPSSSNSNSGVTLLGGPCVLTLGGSCLFQGNINLDSKLSLVDDAYNGQTPAPPVLLALTDLLGAGQDNGFADPHAGAVSADFLVSFFAVKGGDFFRLYEIAPTHNFNWSTAGLLNGGGQQPTVSHVVWFGAADPPPPAIFSPPGDSLSPPGVAIAIPEPAPWALMILGVGLTGAMLRRRRLRLA